MKKLFILKDNPEVEVKSWDDVVDMCVRYFSVTPFQVTYTYCENSTKRGEFSESDGLCMYVVLTNKLGEHFAYPGIINFQP